MMRINDQNKLDYYIDKFDIQNVFDKDMKKYMELLLFNKNEHICRDDEKIIRKEKNSIIILNRSELEKLDCNIYE